MVSMQKTPNANRLHIGIFGKRNSGKSSLINALTGQDTALVSKIAGTTTDPVYKAMELRGIGASLFIDTAGFDDVGELGKLRVEKTKEALSKSDIAIFVFADRDIEDAKDWVEACQKNKTPIIAVVNKSDVLSDKEEVASKIQQLYGLDTILVSSKSGEGLAAIRQKLLRSLPEGYEKDSILAGLAQPNDVVMLVMPQDSEAPKGRLILPQAQTIRELLDDACITVSVTPDTMVRALEALKEPPKLIITDSQVFSFVYEHKPEESKLTSFSILFAAYKGDLDAFLEGAKAIDNLKETSRVLIAEACTHAPLTEDIGRVKLPALLRKKVGNGLTVDIVAGVDFPKNVSSYDLIIHCGACMFNRKYVLSRVQQAKEQRVPMTNYGIALAHLKGILSKVSLS